MVGSSDRKRKGKASTPPAGYACTICKAPGHWIQQCPQKKKQKKRNANPTHVHVPGVDPSQDDIARARELQQIKPPKCDQAYQRYSSSIYITCGGGPNVQCVPQPLRLQVQVVVMTFFGTAPQRNYISLHNVFFSVIYMP